MAIPRACSKPELLVCFFCALMVRVRGGLRHKRAGEKQKGRHSGLRGLALLLH